MAEEMMDILLDIGRQPTFQAAARLLIERMIAVLRAALGETGWADDSELLRGLVHLRPDFGYQGFAAVELAGAAEPAPAALSSMTAWRALCERGCGLLVDVDPAVFAFTDGTRWSAHAPEDGDPVGFRTTHQELRARDVTHLLALPLALGDRVTGMVTLELRCADAVGDAEFAPWTLAAPALERMARLGALVLDRLPLEGPTAERSGPFPAVGPASAAMLDLLEGFARLDAPLLLVGESGTGKSRLAAWVHERGRRTGPFVQADVASLSAEQAAVRLFGSVKGAYTGATNQTGCVHAAQGGTLFIDEVARLSLDSQVQLFRLLDDGRFRRLGPAREEEALVRVVAATNEDLPRAVREGRFRHDLLYRLESFAVEVPPLRRRVEEIDAWATHFLLAQHRRYARNHHARLSPEATLLLRAQRWPGNLRELRGVVERAWVNATVRTSPGAERWPTEVHVTVDDVRGALAASLAREASGSLLPALEEAATAFVLEAERLRREGKGGLALDQAESFRGAVVAAALRQLGDPADAARLLGMEAQIRGSNHLVTFRDAWQRTVDLAKVVGAVVPEAPPGLAGRGRRKRAG